MQQSVCCVFYLKLVTAVYLSTITLGRAGLITNLVFARYWDSDNDIEWCTFYAVDFLCWLGGSCTVSGFLWFSHLCCPGCGDLEDWFDSNVCFRIMSAFDLTSSHRVILV